MQKNLHFPFLLCIFARYYVRKILMKQTFIAGPCVIESAELLDTVAAKLV